MQIEARHAVEEDSQYEKDLHEDEFTGEDNVEQDDHFNITMI